MNPITGDPRIFDLVRPEAADHLRNLSERRAAWLRWKPFRDYLDILPQLPHRHAEHTLWDRAEVTIGENLPEDHPDRQAIARAAKAILPWKKGPYRLFGIPIDAEWRSDYKWDRMADKLPDMRNQRILDVGCNNGYYMFRLLPQRPAYILGIDPVPRLWHQFHLLQRYANCPELAFQMWGWQEAAYFEELFDTIFCMGILYHHRDPMGLLDTLLGALKPGGLLVMESIVIAGEDPICLYPPDRYGKMRNVWFVPTVPAMCHMLNRAKYRDVDVIAVNKHEPAEQRTTPWNPGQSYADFVDPNDPDRTIEGLPAPHRAIVFARKRG